MQNTAILQAIDCKEASIIDELHPHRNELHRLRKMKHTHEMRKSSRDHLKKNLIEKVRENSSNNEINKREKNRAHWFPGEDPRSQKQLADHLLLTFDENRAAFYTSQNYFVADITPQSMRISSSFEPTKEYLALTMNPQFERERLEEEAKLLEQTTGSVYELLGLLAS